MAAGCTTARFATAAAKSELWNLPSVSPSLVSPSGNSPTQSPCASTAWTRSLMRSVSRRSARRTKSVPARSTIQPAMGHSRISLFAMKRVGRTLETRKTSSQETWLAAIITAPPSGGGRPSTCAVTRRMRSSFADHQRTSARRRAGEARGKTVRRMSAAAAACATMRVQRSARTGRLERLMRDARRAAPGQDAHAIARAEVLVALLHHGDVLARVEQHGHFHAAALVGGFLEVLPDDAAEDRAADGAGDLAAAAAGMAARHPAQHRAARRAHAGLARIDLHLAHRLDHAEAHRLLAAHFVAAVVRGAGVIGAAAEDEH